MEIFNETCVKLSPLDAIRALFGKTIHISTTIEVAAPEETEVLRTTQTIHVKTFKKPKGGPPMMAGPVILSGNYA